MINAQLGSIFRNQVRAVVSKVILPSAGPLIQWAAVISSQLFPLRGRCTIVGKPPQW